MFQTIVLFAFLIAIVTINVGSHAGRIGITFRKVPTAIAVVLLVLLFPLGDSFGTVPAGETGVVTQFGAVVPGDLKSEGLYVVTPGIQQVHVLDTRPHKIEISDAEAVTSDRQQVHTSVALLVQIDPAVADKTYDQYRDDVVDQVVMPKLQESIKTVTAKYDAAYQVRNRGAVQVEMLAYIQHELAGKGVVIGPGALSIINFKYDSDYQAAIEQTAVAQQNLVKAEALLKVAQIEAQQKVALARGEAQSQSLLAHTINANSLQFEFYKHWDGHLPSVIGGSSGNILDVSSLLGNKKD